MLSGLHAPSGLAASCQGLQMLTQAQVSHSCRKAWKETAKRTRARAPPWPFQRFPQEPANLWLLLGENHLALLLAHDPWSPPAFTKTPAQD